MRWYNVEHLKDPRFKELTRVFETTINPHTLLDPSPCHNGCNTLSALGWNLKKGPRVYCVIYMFGCVRLYYDDAVGVRACTNACVCVFGWGWGWGNVRGCLLCVRWGGGGHLVCVCGCVAVVCGAREKTVSKDWGEFISDPTHNNRNLIQNTLLFLVTNNKPTVSMVTNNLHTLTQGINERLYQCLFHNNAHTWSPFRDDVIKWKHFPRYWPFVFPVNSPHKDQWRGALIFSLICVWINVWVNSCEAGDLRRYRAHYDVTVILNQWWC